MSSFSKGDYYGFSYLMQKDGAYQNGLLKIVNLTKKGIDGPVLLENGEFHESFQNFPFRQSSTLGVKFQKAGINGFKELVKSRNPRNHKKVDKF